MLPQNQCNYINASQVIAIAKQYLNISTDNYNGFLHIALEMMLRRMYSPAVYGDHYQVMEICDDAFKMPSGAKWLWGIAFCDGTSPSERSIGGAPLLLSNTLAVSTNGQYSGTTVENLATYQKGYWHFNTPTDELYVICYYEGFNVGENGLIEIPESYEDFISMGLCYEFLMKFPSYIGNSFSETARLRQEYRRNYISRKMQVNGIDQVNKASQRNSLWRFAQNKMRMSSPYWGAFNRYSYNY